MSPEEKWKHQGEEDVCNVLGSQVSTFSSHHLATHENSKMKKNQAEEEWERSTWISAGKAI